MAAHWRPKSRGSPCPTSVSGKPLARQERAPQPGTRVAGHRLNPLRIRTVTAGLPMADLADLGRLEATLARLGRARSYFESLDFEVQTLRIATSSCVADLAASDLHGSLAALEQLDRRVHEAGVTLSIGTIQREDGLRPGLAAWAAELIARTRATSFSLNIASDSQGVLTHNLSSAAETMLAISRVFADGSGNFRFAAAAHLPAGTPYFPVAHHEGSESLALGLESASLVYEIVADLKEPAQAESVLRARLNEILQPIERSAQAFAQLEQCRYLGIDPSPAPGLDRSIGAAIEALSGQPFGSAATLQACAQLTGALKSLSIQCCGYSGLFLPVLEDELLAQRAIEQRYGLQQLLLYSSVCGSGLDTIPLAGDVAPTAIARVLHDVAALASRLRKPLSARLMPIPGKRAGDRLKLDSPWLTESVAFAID
jgi:uncharacterized protein